MGKVGLVLPLRPAGAPRYDVAVDLDEAMLETRGKKETKELTAIYAKARAFHKAGKLVKAARSYRFFLSQWPEPTAFYNYGVLLKQMRALDEAVLNYAQAIALKPDYAEAYANIGSIYLEQGKAEQALAAYDQAVGFNPLLVEAWYNRGVALQELRRHEEALADYERVLALRPEYFLAALNKSVILYELKRKREAARTYEAVLRMDPAGVEARWNLGIIRLSEGDFLQGWKLSEARLAFHHEQRRGLLERPYWNGEEVAGKTVFLKWEQGFGDTIQFCRYALLVRDAGARVVLSVQAPLRRLVGSLGDRVEVVGEDEVPADYDYHCFLMSLPSVFGTVVETVPYPGRYLSVDADAVAYWGARVRGQAGARIGIVWAGGYRPDITCARRNDANRSMKLQDFSPLLGVAGAVFYSLQKGPPAAQAACVAGVVDWTAELADFADTGALVETLDLVITVDTAVAHLAAALGKRVWILVPWTSCWRWLEGRNDSPWYGGVRLFRQGERGEWGGVFAAVRRELEGFVAAP